MRIRRSEKWPGKVLKRLSNLKAMLNTLVIQSHRSPLPYSWLKHCLDSVRRWCDSNQFEYRFLNDELFDRVPADLLEKVMSQRVIASDLARIHVLQEAIAGGYETVVWLDADFLIFDPEHFTLPEAPYAVGREVWIQQDGSGTLKVYKKVHNAMLMFRTGNSFLDFYIDTAERLLRQHRGGMAPQFIGPKLLTALHNVAQLPVMESAGMLSPLVIKDIIQGSGEALRLFNKQSPATPAGANVCLSSRDRGEVTCAESEQLISNLINSYRDYLTV